MDKVAKGEVLQRVAKEDRILVRLKALTVDAVGPLAQLLELT